MVSALVKEQWSEYGIGMAVFTLRFFARFKVVGFNGMKWDDLFCFFAMVSHPTQHEPAGLTSSLDILDDGLCTCPSYQ